jgi:hypothetical protein
MDVHPVEDGAFPSRVVVVELVVVLHHHVSDCAHQDLFRDDRHKVVHVVAVLAVVHDDKVGAHRRCVDVLVHDEEVEDVLPLHEGGAMPQACDVHLDDVNVIRVVDVDENVREDALVVEHNA